MRSSDLIFWSKAPALLYSLAVLFGFAAAFSWNLTLCLPIALLLYSANKRALLTLATLLSSFLYGIITYPPSELPSYPIQGKATVTINNFYFSKERWIYQCSLSQFTTKEKVYHFNKLPCSIKTKQKLEGDMSYSVTGRIRQVAPNRYALQGMYFEPLEKNFTFNEWRYRAKSALQQYIIEKIPSEQSSLFLTGIATGEFDDPYLNFEFGRFGLKHIMAISGFHFAIIAMILSVVLRLFFSLTLTNILLILFLSAYFFLLGPRPSVLRAWIMICTGLLAQLLGKQSSSLNAFGISLLVVTLFNPLWIFNLGFQFSFAVTAAILLFHPPLSKLLYAKRSYSKMPLVDQHGHLILSFFRQGLILTLTVHIIALPMILYYFQKFPIFSLLYNLFFPFCVSFSMFLLLLGLATHPLPWLQTLIFNINDRLTQSLINLTYYLPLTADYHLRFKGIDETVLILLLTILFYLGITLHSRLDLYSKSAYDVA